MSIIIWLWSYSCSSGILKIVAADISTFQRKKLALKVLIQTAPDQSFCVTFLDKGHMLAQTYWADICLIWYIYRIIIQLKQFWKSYKLLHRWIQENCRAHYLEDGMVSHSPATKKCSWKCCLLKLSVAWKCFFQGLIMAWRQTVWT